MTPTILVTGGTGTLGQLVVARLRAEGRQVRVLTRHERAPEDGIQFVTGDLLSDEGLGSAVEAAATIIHCASARKGDDQATAKLLRAAKQAGAPHVVYISVVGADKAAFSYLRPKLAAEQIVAESGLPWTTLRSTQFYQWILMGTERMAKLPIVPVPSGFRVQPVDSSEVAARLVELALSEPAGRVADIGGPRESTWQEMLDVYLRARRRRRLVLPIRAPGSAKVRAGVLLPERHDGLDPTLGSKTWEEFLAETLEGRSRRSASAE